VLAKPFEADSHHLKQWDPESWRNTEALQQPNYPDQAKLQEAVAVIKAFPPLVFAGEQRTLQERLADASIGEGFVLFGVCRYAAPAVKHRC
jgi:3-deoxy-7-phosphoheptulonate synthase